MGEPVGPHASTLVQFSSKAHHSNCQEQPNGRTRWPPEEESPAASECYRFGCNSEISEVFGPTKTGARGLKAFNSSSVSLCSGVPGSFTDGNHSNLLQFFGETL